MFTPFCPFVCSKGKELISVSFLFKMKRVSGKLKAVFPQLKQLSIELISFP